jgi:hypothetical protein
MDPNDATQGTSRDLRASQIRSFLTEALAGGAETVVALQERARAAGLLGEGQSIGDAKLFKTAKAALGIRSRRIGFGPGAIWFWILAVPPAPQVATTAKPSDVYDVDPSDRRPEISPRCAEITGGDRQLAPIAWTRGVGILQQTPRPSGIPAHRWCIFVEDCGRFVASRWAKRAADLGWDAGGLFGSRYANPHEHMGYAGLVWSLAGGRILQIHRDGADLLTQDGRAHRHRRRPDGMMKFLPWGCHQGKLHN